MPARKPPRRPKPKRRPTPTRTTHPDPGPLTWHAAHAAATQHCGCMGSRDPGLGATLALIALVRVQRGQWLELRRIRKLLEAGKIAALNLKAMTIPKEGS